MTAHSLSPRCRLRAVRFSTVITVSYWLVVFSLVAFSSANANPFLGIACLGGIVAVLKALDLRV